MPARLDVLILSTLLGALSSSDLFTIFGTEKRMPVLPHNFPTLRHHGNENHRPSVLILGAGMSYDVVPLPGSLLAKKRANAEKKLAFTSTVPIDPNPPADHLYRWADDVVKELTIRGDPNPKLTLAELLDIPKEKHWLGCISTQRNTPRHRVVARFAREGLWHQIWSLNWDCVQESALENVGIKRRKADGKKPWPTVFNTLVTAAECAHMGESNSIKVIKPHGCVMALVDAQRERADGNNMRSIDLSERFLITATELLSLDPTVAYGAEQQFIFATLLTALASHPFIVTGWSVSEKYLIDRIKADVEPHLQNPHRQPPIAVDELSIIDRQFNAKGHASLASFYGKNAATAHVDVGQPGFGTDELFLWLQALYAVSFLKFRAPAIDLPALNELAAEIEQPRSDSMFVISWVDNFLPVWVRLCWRCGLVYWETDNATRVEIDDLALESRDEHIPWRLSGPARPEMISASRILAALHRSGHANNWNYEIFPGGLYRDFHLVIPLPVWASDPPNDLRGLKPLIDSIRQHGESYIVKLSLAFVGPDPVNVISDDTKQIWKQLVASYLSLARFAKADKIDAIQLEDL